jgi:hypothetical protein
MNSIIKLRLGKGAIKFPIKIAKFKISEGQMEIFLIPFVQLYETKINIVEGCADCCPYLYLNSPGPS